jgi:DNA-binding response OmpR family regulator
MTRPEKPHVLLVDDNEAVCTLVAAVLRHDFAVDCLHDGVEAVERLRITNYAAILLDLRMPNLDGFGVLQFLKETCPNTLGHVLILTAAPSPANMARVKEYGVCGIVTKPFEVETLLSAVKDCVGEDGRSIGSILSTGVILLLADFLKQRFL